jgi:hypothetical protein
MQIQIQTDKGHYVGGDIIYGNVHMYSPSPIPSAKELTLKIVGNEKCKQIRLQRPILESMKVFGNIMIPVQFMLETGQHKLSQN